MNGSVRDAALIGIAVPGNPVAVAVASLAPIVNVVLVPLALPPPCVARTVTVPYSVIVTIPPLIVAGPETIE